MYRIRALTAILAGAIMLCASGTALAHKPLLSVGDNQDGTIAIEAGFSDGASAAGHKIFLRDEKTGAVISEHRVGEDGTLQLKKPSVSYTVTLDAGEGHVVTKPGPALSASEGPSGSTKSDAEAATAAPQPVSSPPAPQSQPTATVGETGAKAQPVVAVQASSELSPGAVMAFKMMITAQIVAATASIVILAVIAYFVGYTIGRKNGSM